MFEFFNIKVLDSYLTKYKKVIIIHDQNIKKYYSEFLDQLSYYKYVIEPGESSKNLRVKTEIEDYMFKNNFNKSACMVALGGGVVGDLTGFIASTFMRGIDFIQVPTTLLAMVDSSIGGKTGIDNKWGKNLIGSFYLPQKILCDINFLNTLPEEEFINGMAEVIKTAIVASPELWDLLYENDLIKIKQIDVLKQMIKLTADAKLEIVNEDFKETVNRRHILNFGHTIGHAIEAITLDKHGYCVAIGMCKEILYKIKHEYVVPFYLQKQIVSCIEKYGLPTDLKVKLDNKDFLKKIRLDKKDGLFVSIKSIGEPILFGFSNEGLLDTLSNKKVIKKVPFYKNIDINAPSSKSETNRVLLLAALGEGIIEINNVLMSDDTIHMLIALNKLGVPIKIIGSNKIIMEGISGNFDCEDNMELYLGNSGTCVRFLTAILGLLFKKKITITGDTYMQKRPIQDLLICLQEIGIDIKSINDNGCPPIIINGSKESEQNQKNSVNLLKISTLNSSQYLTGLLIASTLIENDTVIEVSDDIVSSKFIDLTLDIMKDFGINVVYNKNKFLIKHHKYKNPNIYNIQADASSSSYLLGISALSKNKIIIGNLSNKNKQGDTKINEIAMNKLGFRLNLNEKTFIEEFNNPEKIRIIDCDSSDTFLTWVIVSCFIEGTTKIINIDNQNIKECKRIDVIYQHLLKANVDISRDNNDLIVRGSNLRKYKGIYVDCHNDHRIAMSFSLFGYMVPNVKLSNYLCVNKTYPAFWEDMSKCGIILEDYIDEIENKNEYNPIILIGMTKAGKTTLGKHYSQTFNISFIDTDEEITRKYNKTPEEIIKEDGWEYFRDIEENTFVDIINQEKFQIISTGGGIIERSGNIELIIKFKYVIHIIKDIERIILDADNNIWKDNIKNTWEKRKPIYQNISTYQYFNDSKVEKFNRWLNNIITPVKIKNISYFLCLDGSDLEKKKDLLLNLNNVDAIEFRCDLLKSYDLDYIDKQINILLSFSDKLIIFTLRSEEEGGRYIYNQSNQPQKYIERAIYNGVSIIDVELRLNHKIDRKHCLVIGSCHSESWNKMEHITKKGFHVHKPNILKLVGNIKFKDEMIELSNNYNVKKIILHSGEEGKMSRVYNMFLTPVTHSSFNSVAQGQMTVDEIETIRKIILKNKNFYLIGKNVSQSPSPFIHNYVFEHYNLPYKYDLLDISTLNNINDIIRKETFGGASVTMPYKENIMKYLDDYTDDAKIIGAINTIFINKNKLIGDNTDWKALYNIIKKSEIIGKGCVIGTGGAARAACYALCKSNYSFDVVGRNETKGYKLIDNFKGSSFLYINEVNKYHKIVIICVPNNVKIPLEKLSKNTMIIDMSYSNDNPRYYPDGLNIVNGYQVLKDQAIEQFNCWNNIEQPNPLEDIYENAMNCYIHS